MKLASVGPHTPTVAPEEEVTLAERDLEKRVERVDETPTSTMESPLRDEESENTKLGNKILNILKAAKRSQSKNERRKRELFRSKVIAAYQYPFKFEYLRQTKGQDLDEAV
jgi:hypothetical protein